MAIVPVTPAGSIAVPLSLIPQSGHSVVPNPAAAAATGRDSLIGPTKGATTQSVTTQAILINSSSSNNKAAPVASAAVVLTHPVLLSAPTVRLNQPGQALVSLTQAVLSSCSTVAGLLVAIYGALLTHAHFRADHRLRTPSSESLTLASVSITPPPPPLIPQLPVTMSLSRDESNGVPETAGNTTAALPALTAVSVTPSPQTAEATAVASDDAVAAEADGGADSGSADDEAVVEDVPLDFDPQSVMEWTAGVGTLPDSNLKFRVGENGGLEMIGDDEAVRIQKEHSDKQQTNGTAAASSGPAAEEQVRTCVHCGKTGPLKNFIRAGKFCSQECATSQASQLKSLVKSLELDCSDGSRNGRSGVKQESGRGRHMDLAVGRGSPQSEKRKHMLREDSPQTKVRRGMDEENDENSVSRQRPDPLMTGKLKAGRFGKKNRVKELRNEETTSLIDSEKLSLPSSPSSSLVPVTPQSALHQSIFSMRVLQHQQEPPLGWDRHSKNLHPVLQNIRPPDVLRWDPDKVAAFVNTIPGCRDIGQTFADEVSILCLSRACAHLSPRS